MRPPPSRECFRPRPRCRPELERLRLSLPPHGGRGPCGPAGGGPSLRPRLSPLKQPLLPDREREPARRVRSLERDPSGDIPLDRECKCRRRGLGFRPLETRSSPLPGRGRERREPQRVRSRLLQWLPSFWDRELGSRRRRGVRLLPLELLSLVGLLP